MRGFIVRVAQIAVTLTVGLAILASLAVWRLSQGPVSLNFLTPALERTFSVEDTPFAVQVGDTSLVWGGWRRVADLRVRNTRIYGPDGKLMALLPELSIGLSLRGLIQGDLAVSRLDVMGLRARVERLPDGRFDFEMPVEAGDETIVERSPGSLVQGALRPLRERTGPFKYLRRFALVGAKFLYADRQSGNLWQLPGVDLVTEFHLDGIDTKLALILDVDGKRTELVGTIIHDLRSGRTGGRVDFNSLQPALIARAIPDVREVANLEIPLSGAVNFEFGQKWKLLGLNLRLKSEVGDASVAMRYPTTGGPTEVVLQLDKVQLAALARAAPALASLSGMEVPVSGRISGLALASGIFRVAAIDVTSGAGRVELPGILPQPVQLSRARLAVEIADDQASMTIQEVLFDFGGPKISLTGRVERSPAQYRLRADAKLAQASMADLDKYWPLALGETARQWVVENIAKGTVSEGAASMVLHAPADDPWSPTLESINGELQYQGLAVNFWDRMPKVVDVGGTATFDAGRFDFAVTNGSLNDVAVEQAVIGITGLDKEDQDIAIDVGLRGPAQRIADILDRKPLGYIARFGVTPKAVSGDAVMRATFAFPLVTDLALDQLQVTASGTLRNFGVASMPYDLSIGAGDLKLKMTNDAIDVNGSLELSSVPMTVDWRENFTDGSELRRRLVLAGRVPDLGRLGFGVPAVDVVRGPAEASLILTGKTDGTTELLAGFELEEATISVPELDWTKPAGVPGTANVLLAMKQDSLLAIEQFSVETDKTKLLGSARPRDVGPGAWRVAVDRFENGDVDFSGKIDLGPENAVAIDVSGKRFDVGPLLDELSRGEPEPAAEQRQYRVSARFEELRWGPDKRLNDANLLVRHNGEVTQALVLDGTLGERAALSVKYLPGPDGQILRVSADDFGETLAVSPSKSRVSGGTLLIRGLRPTPDAPLTGNFLASRFRVSRAPLLARVLQVASLSGIVDALSRKGLAFDAFEGDFLYREGRLTLSKASAHGSSVGVTANGVLDFNDESATLGGTLVPAYSLNRAIGKIPVIGSLLTGGAQEGVFAATYRAVGPLENPKVTVNPLSALAPGFLRNLFGLGARPPKGDATTPPPTAPN